MVENFWSIYFFISDSDLVFLIAENLLFLLENSTVTYDFAIDDLFKGEVLPPMLEVALIG